MTPTYDGPLAGIPTDEETSASSTARTSSTRGRRRR